MTAAENRIQTNEAAVLPPVVLASASPSRRMLLTAAGVNFSIAPANLDEHETKRMLKAEAATPQEIALTLAALKAARVSVSDRTALVIGADQIMTLGDRIIDKPVDREAARATLLESRGRDHALHTAVAVASDGAVIWRRVETATLTMRPFSDTFLEAYLDASGEALLSAVGAYRLEGLGIQLFSHIDGDYFNILGLPLLPLITWLREQGALMS